MILRYPAYFEAFTCLAGDCPDSCCKEWEVQVDEETAAKYAAMEGPLGQQLRKFLYRDEEGEQYLRLVDGRCPMWRTDGLCRIQAACGHESLCRTCREFPRLTHDYGTFVERGLELSCPEAARLILQSPESRWVEMQIADGEGADYDRQDMELLLAGREKMLTLLADDRRPVPQTLALALLYGYQIQTLLDGGEGQWDEEQALAFARGLAKPNDGRALMGFYRELDILTDAWRSRLNRPPASGAWAESLRKLARYGVERYWLQAISDFDLVGRVKMVVLSCILVHLLGGDVVQTAQLYGKEIENSPENVEAILEGAYSHPALTDEQILGLLL